MTSRTPTQKRRLGPPRRGSEPDDPYLKWIREQACAVCELLSIRRSQFSFLKIEAAHVGERGMGQKCPDRQAIPLCIEHHTQGKHSYHRNARGFWAHWKLDRFELIEGFNARYEEETGIPRKPIRNESQQEKEIA